MSVRTRGLVRYIVSEVSAIQDHHIGVLNRFPVNPPVETGFVGWANTTPSSISDPR
jgi:hypothetical protein